MVDREPLHRHDFEHALGSRQLRAPSCPTAVTKRLCSSGVHLSRGFADALSGCMLTLLLGPAASARQAAECHALWKTRRRVQSRQTRLINAVDRSRDMGGFASLKKRWGC